MPEAIPVEERKLVTVLFADLVGSTELGERLDAEQLRMLLGEYFEAMASAIESWGGTVEKFIGDAVMAAFGVPTVREDDAERAVHAAQEMLARLDVLNHQFERRHGVVLTLRVGINTGDVIAPVGDHTEEMIVAGDAVNVAARLQGAAEPGTVLVGERTFHAARGAFEFSEAIELSLKGKSEPVRARRLVRAKGPEARPILDMTAPLVGRSFELTTLRGLLADVADRSEVRLAVVHGPAGIGKSRLLAELVKIAQEETDRLTVLHGRCLAVGERVGFWALSEILRQACGFSGDDPSDMLAKSLPDRLAEVLSLLELSAEERLETIHALAISIGVSLAGNPFEEDEPRVVGEAMARAWPRLVSALATRGPVLLVIEDLHWAGDELLVMLERLLSRTTGPVLLLASTRPDLFDEHPVFAGTRADVLSLALRPLTSDQGLGLLEGMLGSGSLQEDVRQAILERAEGNPFFLEEMVRRMIDRGDLVRADGEWRLGGERAELSLPDTIHALLASRIDALEPHQKLVLQEASVVGRVFWEAPLVAVLSDVDVSAALLVLEEKGLVAARSTSAVSGEREYGFRHVLVRDVAYASVPRARRARSHAALTEWVEGLPPEVAAERVEMLADHYWMAVGDPDAEVWWGDEQERYHQLRSRAYEALMRAGTTLRRRYGLTRAVEMHRRAAEIAPREPERMAALEAIGDDHAAAYHGDPAVAAYLEALDLARERGDRQVVARLAMKSAREAVIRAGTFESHPGMEKAEALIEEGLAQQPSGSVLGWLLALWGDLYEVWISFVGRDPVPLEERLASAERALNLARELGKPNLEAFAAEIVMILAHGRGDLERCIEVARERLVLVDRVELATSRAAILFMSGSFIQAVEGRYEEALELQAKSQAIARSLSSHEEMHATGSLIELLYLLGRWDEALPLVDVHTEKFEAEANVSCGFIRLGPTVGALILAHRGEATEARRLLDRIPESPRTLGFVDGYALEALVALGEAEEALARADEVLGREGVLRPGPVHIARLEALAALGLWDRMGEAIEAASSANPGHAALRPVVERLQALHLLMGGHEHDAREPAGRAVEEARYLGLTFELGRSLEVLASVGGGDKHATEALDIYRHLAARPHIERVKELADG